MDATDREYRISIPVFFLVLAILSYFAPADHAARAVVRQIYEQALHGHEQGESLNVAVSIVKSLRIRVEPMGVGLTIPIGESLDSLDILVERYTLLLLASTLTLESYDFLLQLLSSWSWAAGSALFFLMAAVLFVCGSRCITLYRCTLFLAMIRFVFPLAMICTGEVYSSFFHQSYVETRQHLESVTLTLQKKSQQLIPEKNEQQDDPNQSYIDMFLSGLSNSYDSAKAAAGSLVAFPVRVKDTIVTYVDEADDIRNYLFALMKMFFIISFVLPSLFTALLWLGMSRLFMTQTGPQACGDSRSAG